MDIAAWIVGFLFVYLIFIAILFYTILLGGSARHESTMIGRANTFLTSTLCARIQYAVGALCCSRAEDPAASAGNAFSTVMDVFERYVMPAVYLSLLCAGLAAAKATIIPWLGELSPPDVDCPRTKLVCVGPASAVLTIPPRTNPEALWFYAVLSFGSWLAVFLADPGIVSSGNHAAMSRVYEYDDIIYVRGKECKTCKHTKLPRTKHDKLLNICVIRYDHYCGWTGNVVGLYNTNRFLFFLLIHLTMLFHGAMLCAEIVYHRMLQIIDGNYIYTPTDTVITGFNPVVAFAAEPTVCLFFFVLLISVCVVGGFLIYHIYLVACNTTTAETFKWSPIHEACKTYMKENGFSYSQKLREEAEAEAQNGNSQMLQELPQFNEDGSPVNIYDRGMLENAVEVLFPRRFASRAVSNSDQSRRSKYE